MKTFEQQLADSARRLRDADNYRLPAPRRRPRCLAWGWLATPAAAVVGLLVGTGLPRTVSVPATPLAEARPADTVVKLRTVHDTVFLPAPPPSRPAAKTAAADITAADPVLPADTLRPQAAEGCNVLCDGVDYTLLVRL